MLNLENKMELLHIFTLHSVGQKEDLNDFAIYCGLGPDIVRFAVINLFLRYWDYFTERMSTAMNW